MAPDQSSDETAASLAGEVHAMAAIGGQSRKDLQNLLQRLFAAPGDY